MSAISYLFIKSKSGLSNNLLCCRSVSGVDVDPDLVHMEMQDTSGGTVTFHLLIYVMILLGLRHASSAKF